MASSVSASSSPECNEGLLIATLILHSTRSHLNHSCSSIQIYSGKNIQIGRAPYSDLVVEDQLVSKGHFRIYSILYDSDDPTQHPPLIFCEDLQSTNGTYVNDTLIGKLDSTTSTYLLTDGDIITIRPSWAFHFHQPTVTRNYVDRLQAEEIGFFEEQYALSNRVLGSGVHGIVYLAHNILTEQQLACKVINLGMNSLHVSDSQVSSQQLQTRAESSPERIMPSESQQPEPVKVQGSRILNRDIQSKRDKAFREIHLLRDLDHPNIISIKKAFYSPYTLYVFFELATGGDLFSYLKSQGGMVSELHARVITRQLANAVKFIHARGIAHRDIKLENILAMRTDIGHRVVLTDFGFATSFTASSRRMVSLCGTAGYVAPEVYSSHGYTEAVDLWSLGVVLVCLLTGDFLVSCEDRQSLSECELAAKLVLDDAQTWNRSPWNNISTRPKDMIKKLLVLEPANRLGALEAANHCWFCEPAQIAEELRQLDKRALRCWKPRSAISSLVEEIPDVHESEDVRKAEANSGQSNARKRKLPDTTRSAYFSLDRHLQARPRSQSQQRRLLKQLKETGSQFTPSVPAKHASKTTSLSAGRAVLPTTRFEIRDVDGKDIFGSNSNDCDLSHENQADDNIGSPSSSEAGKAVIQDYSMESENLSLESPVLVAPSEAYDDKTGPRLQRRYTETLEDRVLFDEVAKNLPMITSAKNLKNVVLEKKALSR